MHNNNSISSNPSLSKSKPVVVEDPHQKRPTHKSQLPDIANFRQDIYGESSYSTEATLLPPPQPALSPALRLSQDPALLSLGQKFFSMLFDSFNKTCCGSVVNMYSSAHEAKRGSLS